MSMQPPALSKLYDQYLLDDPGKNLRVGQYFWNKYLSCTIREIKYPYNFDKLYNSTNFDEIYEILTKIYQDYQWEL